VLRTGKPAEAVVVDKGFGRLYYKYTGDLGVESTASQRVTQKAYRLTTVGETLPIHYLPGKELDSVRWAFLDDDYGHSLWAFLDSVALFLAVLGWSLIRN
jgi:hypothetical protein